jgi:hypothetical protein
MGWTAEELAAAGGVPLSGRAAAAEQEATAGAAATPGAPEKAVDYMEDVDRQTMHPDISNAHRWAIKNFQVDPDRALAYLQQKYPNLDIRFPEVQSGLERTPIKRQILIKAPGEAKYKVLDPEGLNFSWEGLKEVGRDVADAGWDIGAGTASTGASALAGTAAALAASPTSPIGMSAAALGAGSAAGGATSGALEALRQKIGKAMGMAPDDLDMGHVGMAAGGGALAPLLFGTGGQASTALKMSMPKNFMPFAANKVPMSPALLKEAEAAFAPELAAQRGLIGRGADLWRDTIAPSIQEATSGINKQDILRQRGMTRAELNMPPEERTRIANEAINNAQDTLSGLRFATGTKLEPLKASGAQVDITPAANIADDLVQKLQTQADTSRTGAASVVGPVDAAMEKLREVMGAGPLPPQGPRPTEYPVSFAEAYPIKEGLDETIKKFKTNSAVGALAGDKASYGEKELTMRLNDMRKAQIDAMNTATGGAYKPINAELEKLHEAEDALKPLFNNDPVTASLTLQRIANMPEGERAAQLFGYDTKYGLNLKDTADRLHTAGVFKSPGFKPVSGQGGTSTSASLNQQMFAAPAESLARASGEGWVSPIVRWGGTLLSAGTMSPWGIKNFWRPIGVAERAVSKALRTNPAAALTRPANLGRTGWQLMNED